MVARGVVQLGRDFNGSIEKARKKNLKWARPNADPMHMFSNLELKLKGKTLNQAISEPTVLCTEHHVLQMKDAMHLFCCHAPTADMMDILLDVFLGQCRIVLKEDTAVDYLERETYVWYVPLEELQAWRIPVIQPHKAYYKFCVAWQGLFGNYPGTDCGNQPAEAFTSMWQTAWQNLGRTGDLVVDFETMQEPSSLHSMFH